MPANYVYHNKINAQNKTFFYKQDLKSEGGWTISYFSWEPRVFYHAAAVLLTFKYRHLHVTENSWKWVNVDHGWKENFLPFGWSAPIKIKDHDHKGFHKTKVLIWESLIKKRIFMKILAPPKMINGQALMMV